MQEWKEWIETHLDTMQEQTDELHRAERETSGLMQYRLSVARRMMQYWYRYRRNEIMVQDFYSSLRSYLLVWNVDIMLPSFVLEQGERYGLMQDTATGRIFVNYAAPSYLNDTFLRAAYMQGVDELVGDTTMYDLHTNPYVHALTGFSKYRSIEQKLAVAGALRAPDGYTTLIAMLTGGGKSLVTQTIAFQKEEGLTIVIVPTISLMLDQERNAKALIRNADEDAIFCYYHEKKLDPFYHALDQGHARLLFVSPEALIQNQDLRKKLIQANRSHRIKNLIIDEAHIVIEWGSSFRVDYQCLDSFQRDLLREDPTLRTFLMSATYSGDVVSQLKHFFARDDRWIEIRCDRLRHEPRYCIVKAANYHDRRRKLEELIGVLPRPMIIYVNSPETAERTQAYLRELGLTNTRTFTGQTSPKDREELIRQWADQEFDLMIATCAFGVGVDKKDVRTVLHLYVPENPNKYYQEAGRGGRDGLPCLSVVLYAEEDIDTAFHRMEKVLTTEKLSGRWYSMLNSRKTIRRVGEILIDTSVKPRYNDTDGFWGDVSDVDISWNVYVLLLLRRHHLIDILDVQYEDKRYVFTIKLLDPVINLDGPAAKARFKEIRDSEWDTICGGFVQMRTSLHEAGPRCWSEMFNEVYRLTEPYCAGCNAHISPINEEMGKFPLLKILPALPASCADRIADIMDGADEMLLLMEDASSERLVQKLVEWGVDCVVCDRSSEIPDAVMRCENERSTCMMIRSDILFEFASKGPYYLTGSMVIMLPTKSRMVLRLLDAANALCRRIGTKVILIAQEDMWLQARGKKLSELVDGPCKQAYLIWKEE